MAKNVPLTTMTLLFLMILALSYFHITSAAPNVQLFPARDGDELGYVQAFPARNKHEIEKMETLLNRAGMRSRVQTSCSCYNCGTSQCYCRGCSSEFCCI